MSDENVQQAGFTQQSTQRLTNFRSDGMQTFSSGLNSDFHLFHESTFLLGQCVQRKKSLTLTRHYFLTPAFAIIRALMRITPQSWTGKLFILADIPVMFLILLAAYFVRFHTIFPSPLGIPELNLYMATFLLISIMLFFLFALNGVYQKGFRFTPDLGWDLSKNIFLGFLILSSLAFFYREEDFSRTTFLISLGLLLPGMNLFYYFKNLTIRIIAPGSFRRNNIMIIGTGNRALQIYEQLKQTQKNLNLSLIGPSTVELPSDVNYLGPLEKFKVLIKEYVVDQVIVALPNSSIKHAVKIIEECESRRIKFSVVPDLFEVVTKQVTIGEVHGVPVVSVGSNLPIYGLQMKIRHVLDFLISLASLIVLSPLFFTIAVLIKLEDRGPIFYFQDRVGLDGEIFRIWKFRSMRVDAEQQSGPMWAIKGDPRWTKMGTILRKTSIDELPQLYNVLKGEMSLVGPRPERPVFVNEFKENIPGYMLRHKVRGGLTGWSQCNGLRGQTPIEDRTAYDLYYVENWSLLFDLRILFQTVFKLVFIQSGY